MKLTIHQPQYLPWLLYFDKIDRADTFVYLDDVQYQKDGFQNRNQIKSSQGKQWLTVPVIHDFGQKISEVEINNREHWRDKHWKSLKYKYSKAEYFDQISEKLNPIYNSSWEKLVKLNIETTNLLIDLLNIEVDLLRSSNLEVNGRGSEKVLNICKSLEADTYISGQGGKDYLSLGNFGSAGINVVFQEYNYPEYTQLYMSQGFIPELSVVDLLFNCGPDSLEILRSGREL